VDGHDYIQDALNMGNPGIVQKFQTFHNLGFRQMREQPEESSTPLLLRVDDVYRFTKNCTRLAGTQSA